MGDITIAIVSDIHYAGPGERARGNDYEYRNISNPLLRHGARLHRRHVWLREPLGQNHLLDSFLRQADGAAYAIANGDYSCNSAFVGVSDPAARESAGECLGRLRTRFGTNFRATMGDHELGKVTLCGDQGGMRLESWKHALELGIDPVWRLDIGLYTLVGVVSSLVALPVFEADTRPEDRPAWQKLRSEHLQHIRSLFSGLQSNRRVLLFCHDPTALPFLREEDAVRARLPQIEQTIIGHLHSPLILKAARCLSGMPRIEFLGHTGRRLSSALRQARHWEDFKIRLCPSLAGLEMLQDGGFYLVSIDPDGRRAAQFCRRRLGRVERSFGTGWR